MIFEFLTYLTTKTSKEARIFGHLYESIAIIQREKRCRFFWKSHRDECKSFIKGSITKLSTTKKVIVFGSGPLHEIPIEELSKKFEQVDLVDVVHLYLTKKKISHLKNVNFIESDITELEEIISEKKIITNRPPQNFLNEQYDLVISANLLTQLPHHLINFIKKNSPKKYTEEQLNQFGNKIAEDHFNYITNFKCPAILIMDTESHYIDSGDKTAYIEYPYINFKLPKADHEWWWDLAPKPEMSKDYSIRMKVAAFNLNFH